MFTSDHERRMYPRIEALIHHTGREPKALFGFEAWIARIRPTLPSEMRSEIGRP
jgi:hypothetical protein